MLIKPLISGMVVTDKNGWICDDKLNVIVRDERVPKTIQMLDSTILEEYISGYANATSTLFVVGKNTYNQMPQRMTRKMKSVIISDENGVEFSGLATSGRREFHSDQSTTSQLHMICHAMALKHNKIHIIVLGGKSVYESFAGQYDEFYHCIIDRELTDKGKRVYPRYTGSGGGNVKYLCTNNGRVTYYSTDGYEVIKYGYYGE